MKAKLSIVITLILNYCIVFAQSNSWVKVTSNQIGNWYSPAVAYSQKTKQFILTMGSQNANGQNNMYSVQSFTHKRGGWINSLPHDTLYGKWADSTGFAYGKGTVGPAIFGTSWWAFKNIQGYLRPNTGTTVGPRPYAQFCYNTDDGKIYYYIANTTFTYDPSTRRWDTLSVNTQPTAGNIYSSLSFYNFTPYLKWGAMCYDQYNKEIVLFGGTGLDNNTGSPGTWTFKPGTKTWTKLNLPVEPSPIAYSAMVYDPDNKIIVMFGGDHLDKLKNETWVYNCITRTWSQKNPAIRPSPRAGHAMLFMPKSRKVVLVGGYNYQTGNIPEVWTYNVGLNTWKLIKHFGPGETSLIYVPMKPGISTACAVDKGDTIIAISDSTGSIYKRVWQTYRMACDPTIIDASGTTTYGLTADTVIYYSTDPAYYTTGVAPPDTGATETFLRNLPLNTWTQLTPPRSPVGSRDYATTILDTDRDLILKWGGGHSANCANDVPQYSIHTNRYNSGYPPEYPLDYDHYEGPPPGPYAFSGRPFMATHPEKQYAYDSKSHLLVYVWGQYTWLYDPDSMDWLKNEKIHNLAFNANNFNAGLCSTPRGVYCMFGRTSSKGYLFDAKSKKWNQLPLTGDMGGYYSATATLVYDSKRDRIITIQVLSNISDTAKIYEYSFSTGIAKKIIAKNSGIAMGRIDFDDAYRECVYIPDMDIVLFQVQYKGSHLVYDCANNAWTTMPIKNFTINLGGNSAGLMYDPKRKLIWVSDDDCIIYVARLTSQLIGINKLKDQETISINTFPNPFSSITTINVSSSADIKNATLQVFNCMGERVADLSDQLSEQSIQFNATGLSEGIYVIRLSMDNKTFTQKVSYLK